MRSLALAALVALGAGGCLVAAAGAGAGGAVYLSDRGAESLVSAPVVTVLSRVRTVFGELSITETRTTSDQEGSVERRGLHGTAGDREVEVSLRSEGSGTRVHVVVKKTAVTWDNDFAKTIVERIVAQRP